MPPSALLIKPERLRDCEAKPNRLGLWAWVGGYQYQAVALPGTGVVIRLGRRLWAARDLHDQSLK